MEEVNAAFAAIMTWFGKMNDKMNGKPPGENTTGEKMSDDNETDDKETDDDKVVGERVTASATEQGNPSSHGAALLHDSSDTTVARTKKADDPVVTYATAIAMQLMSMALLVSVFLMEEDDSVKIAPTAELPAPSRTQTPTPPTDSATEKGSPGAQEAMFHDSEDTTVTPTEKVDGDGVKYPTGIAMQLITLALLLSVFLMALDNTIIATAIPKITNQFHSLPDVGWYGSAYLLTTASFQLLFGKLYTYFSIKWVYIVAISLFELGSLVCGAAPNSTALIVGRAIAGLGSAGIFSGALIIISYSVPLVQRPTYTGFLGAVYGIASVAGPLLGGVFTDKATWRWCFLINLPIGAITIIVIIFTFTPPEREAVAKMPWRERIKELDLLGTAVFIPGIICLLLALQWGGTKHPWSDGRIIALFVLFGIFIIAFVAIQIWKGDAATVPPSIIKNRSIASAAFFAFAFGSAFFLLVYYLPIWFQAVKGASAVKSGIMNLPMVLTLVISSILSGIAVTLIGYYAPLMIASTILVCIGMGLMVTFTPDTGHAQWIGYQAIIGIGAGLGTQQPLIVVPTVLHISQVPVGTSVMAFIQTLGGALFVSIGQNVFANKLVKELGKHAPSLDPKVVLSTGATQIQSQIDKSLLPGVTLAYNNALVQAFLVATIMGVLSIIGALTIEWKSVKEIKPEPVQA